MLRVFGLNIRLFANDKVGFADYDRVSDVKRLYIGKNAPLPFSFHYDKYYEVEKTYRELEGEEAVAASMDESYKSLAGRQIIDTQSEVSGDRIKITFECMESIAEKQGILREATNDNGEESGG